MDSMTLIILSACAYVVGAIPVGYVIARWGGIDNIFEYGSGSMGATNVGRSLGWLFFFMVLLGDTCKAYGMMIIAQWYTAEFVPLFCVAGGLMLGNSYSLFTKGRGGKGVATLYGIILSMCSSIIIGMFTALWLWGLIKTKKAGRASLIAVSLLPFICWAYRYNGLFFIPLSIFILFRHKAHVIEFLQQINR